MFLISLELSIGDRESIKQHLKSSTHCKYEKAHGLRQIKAVTIDSNFLAAPVQRASTVSMDNQTFRMKILFGFMVAGIALIKLDLLRPVIENVSDSLLCRSSELKAEYVKKLLDAEFEVLEAEFKDCEVLGAICDTTPRLGDVFNVIARFVLKTKSRLKWCSALFTSHSLCNAHCTHKDALEI